MTVKTRHTRFIQTETDPNVHNCDVLIKTISNFFYKHEHHMLIPDNKKILSMLKTIEDKNQHLSEQERKSMYNNLKKMKRHYNEGR